MAPGQPFDVLLDRSSKRKIQASVGWKRDDRLFGTDAFNLVSIASMASIVNDVLRGRLYGHFSCLVWASTVYTFLRLVERISSKTLAGCSSDASSHVEMTQK